MHRILNSTLRDQLMFFYFTKFFANTMDDVPSLRKLLLYIKYHVQRSNEVLVVTVHT